MTEHFCISLLSGEDSHRYWAPIADSKSTNFSEIFGQFATEDNRIGVAVELKKALTAEDSPNVLCTAEVD